MNTQLPPPPPSVGSELSTGSWAAGPASAEEPATGRKPERLNWRRKAIILAVMVGLMASAAVGGAFLGARREVNHWRPLYTQAMSQVALSQTSSHEYQGQLEDLQGKITSSVGSLDNPHFVLWNSCGLDTAAGCPLTPGYEYVGGVPDTFTYDLSFRSTVPVTVRIMTTHDYVCWKSGYCAAHGVWWQDLTSLHDVFHDAEGCAGYLAVFTSKQAGTLYPDVSITRNPAPDATGACA